MRLQNWRELEVTREKLRLLEEHYEMTAHGPCEDDHLRDLTLQSLKRLINQMKEEIAVFECHAIPSPSGGR